MKTIIIFFATFFATILGTHLEDYRLTLDMKYHDQCAEKSEAAADHIALIRKGALKLDDMNSKDKCYIVCMLEQNNILDPRNYLRANRFTKGMSEVKAKKVKNLMRTCFNRTQRYKQECTNVVNILYCFMNLMETAEDVKLIIVYKVIKSVNITKKVK